MLVAEEDRLADILERLNRREPQPPIAPHVAPASHELPQAHIALRGSAIEMIGIPGPNWTSPKKQER